jgi:hypothetical protein
LERVVFNESLLKLAEPVVLREALDRGHGLVLVHHRERHARFDPPSVQKDGAGAALAAIATLLRSGQSKFVAQCVEQSNPSVNGNCRRGSVDAERHVETLSGFRQNRPPATGVIVTRDISLA